MKYLIQFSIFTFSLFAFIGCSSTAFDTPTALATEQAATEASAILILKNNPSYVPAVRQLAASITGTVDAQGVANAIAALPVIDQKERDTITTVGSALEAALATYQLDTNKPILPGDSTAGQLVAGFAAGLTKACNIVSPAPTIVPIQPAGP